MRRSAIKDCYFVGGEAVASNDGSLHLWDLESVQRLLRFEADASPFTAFRPMVSNPFSLAVATPDAIW